VRGGRREEEEEEEEAAQSADGASESRLYLFYLSSLFLHAGLQRDGGQRERRRRL